MKTTSLIEGFRRTSFCSERASRHRCRSFVFLLSAERLDSEVHATHAAARRHAGGTGVGGGRLNGRYVGTERITDHIRFRKYCDEKGR